jgi:AmmeMemoRadiSam system protein B
MRVMDGPGSQAYPVRRPAVAGTFYPGDPVDLAALVDQLLAAARPTDEALSAAQPGLAGILVPHAGLVYSGPVAAAAWRLISTCPPGRMPPSAAEAADATSVTIVLLGTNHGAGWLHGVGVWDVGAWRTPLGDVRVDEGLAAAILGLGPPFRVDHDAHRSEHSLEVQLPFIRIAMPHARIVPLAVSTGSGDDAVRAGDRLGRLIAERRRRGAPIALVISTDMAHYPTDADATRVTDALIEPILALQSAELARSEVEIRDARLPGLVCGMCGIEPAVAGLAALRAMGVERGVRLAAATSADAGGPPDRTVGYLAAAFRG